MCLISGCIAVSLVQPNSKAASMVPTAAKALSVAVTGPCYSHSVPFWHRLVAISMRMKIILYCTTLCFHACLLLQQCCFAYRGKVLEQASRTKSVYSTDDVVVQTHVQVTNSNYCSQCQNITQAFHS